MKPYKILMFDFDGVLADSLEPCMTEINRLVRSDFPALPVVSTQHDMANIYSTQLRHSLQRFGLSDQESADFFDQHTHAMLKHVTKIEPFYDVINALQKCPVPVVIITSSHTDAVTTILDKTDSRSRQKFDHILGFEHPGGKIEKIQQILKEYKLEASEGLYIGDMASDILYCREVPVDVAAVGYGYHPAEYLQQFNPEHLLKSPDDLIIFLDDIYQHHATKKLTPRRSERSA